MRLRVLLTTIVGALVLLALTGASTAGEADRSKLSAGLAQVVDEGGYPGDLPVDQLIDGYRAGDVYYLAKLRGGVNDAVVGDLEDAGATVRFRYPTIGWVALVSTVDTIGAVSRHPNVTRLELDRFHEVLQITTTPAAPADQAKRGTHDVGADALWADGITGKGVVVGVADSGIDSAHPDLDDQDWLRWDALTAGEGKVQAFVDCNTSAPTVGGECTPVKGYDDNGHGTHVSGIAAGSAEGLLPGQNGKLPGMAPEASLVGAKACNAAGSCLNSAVMASLQFLATEKADGGGGADVVNVSLGSGRFYLSPLCCAEQVTNNDPEAQLVNQLAEKNNVVFTISAGNSGPFIQSVGSPSVAAQSISVAASIADFDLNHPTAETEHGVYGNIRPEAAAAGAAGIARFSSRGPSGDRLAKPDLTAPGVFYVAAEASEGAQIRSADAGAQNHYSDDPGYAVLSGTSMSAPAAAGATALVIDGYRRFAGESPAYYRVKAALANTAGTRAFEGSVTGLTGSVRVKITGEDPNKLSPIRNDAWVGVTGEGAGRIHAPSALIALTKGVTVYTPQDGALDDIHELQPSWSLDEVPRGHSASQTFVVHGGPALPKGAKMSFGVENQTEPVSVNEAPAAWFALPKSVKPMRSADVPFVARLNVPADAAPGLYAATLVATVKLGDATQNVRIPVQFYVDLVDADPAEGTAASIEEKIWASDTTDYSAAGFYAEDIYTDWVTYPVRLTEGTDRVDVSVYDVAGKDRMDVFVFDSQGQEIDSTVTGYLRTAVPGGVLNTPTSKESPATISILDGNDSSDITLPATVWVAVSNTAPATPATFSTFHLDVDVVGGTAGTGTTPAERIHSGSHAWWSGSVGGASSHLTQNVDLSGVTASANPSLRFWAWYQLEEGYDWAYALVSTDGGTTWTSLATTAANGSGTTTMNPIGDTGGVLGGSKAYPNGLTGTSGHAAFTSANLFAPTYTEHTADLSPYAGKQVMLRFLYTSDSGTHYENLYVDDVRIVDSSGTPLSVGVTNPDDMETQAGWTSGGVPGFSWVTADTAG